MMLRILLLLLVCGSLVCGSALPAVIQPAVAQPTVAPQPPCDARLVYPPYGEIDGKPLVATWREADLLKLGWQSGPCLGWQGDSRAAAALAARFRSTQTLDQLGARLAAVSRYPEIKYWAITRQGWRPLAVGVRAVAGPEGRIRQPDPPIGALQPGRDFYYAEDAELAGRTVYRLRALEHSADRLVLETENVSPIRVAIVTLFAPGALQVATFLERLDAATWGLYEITRASADSSSMVATYMSSYVNRLEAIRRLLTGEPTDGAPPIARW
jgi:hypothetical protein